MKLSEAIRLGAKLRPQTQAALIDEFGSCAIGAAWEGMNGLTPTPIGLENTRSLNDKMATDVVHVFPILAKRDFISKWPSSLEAKRNYFTSDNPELYAMIVELNDQFDWTREQIADWVATLEASEVKNWSIEDTRNILKQITNGVEQNEPITSD